MYRERSFFSIIIYKKIYTDIVMFNLILSVSTLLRIICISITDGGFFPSNSSNMVCISD